MCRAGSKVRVCHTAPRAGREPPPIPDASGAVSGSPRTGRQQWAPRQQPWGWGGNGVRVLPHGGGGTGSGVWGQWEPHVALSPGAALKGARPQRPPLGPIAEPAGSQVQPMPLQPQNAAPQIAPKRPSHIAAPKHCPQIATIQPHNGLPTSQPHSTAPKHPKTATPHPQLSPTAKGRQRGAEDHSGVPALL